MINNYSDAGQVVQPLTSHRFADSAPYLDWSVDRFPWMDDAACLHMLEWVDCDPKQTRPICLGDESRKIPQCPVLEACAKRALGMTPLPEFGVWAGMTPRQLREKRLQEKGQTVVKVVAA